MSVAALHIALEKLATRTNSEMFTHPVPKSAPKSKLKGKAGVAAIAAAGLGAAAGAGALGAGVAAGKMSKKKKSEKKASISEYSALFRSIDAGEHGAGAKAALQGVTETLLAKHANMSPATTISSDEGTLVRSPLDNSPLAGDYSISSGSRERRLAELLRKREYSHTSTGSASPAPPRS